MEKPKYKHDCNNCEFLGSFEESDLYICSDSNYASLISRESSNPSDYRSGVWIKNKYFGSSHNSLMEALNRAKKKGYINADSR